MWVIVISFLVSIGTLSVRRIGWLEFLELAAYDWTLRIRPNPPQSPSPITLINITEEDIRNLGRWPITDRTLADALKTLVTYEPRAIGFDLYRDLEVPPGRKELNQVLTTHEEVVGIMKFGEIANGGIPPPMVLQETNQVGFSDMVVDHGGIVRRGLLFLDDGENTYTSFALRLALLFLESEGIFLESDPTHPEFLKLGTATFPPFEGNDGAYINADSQGYQFLLDIEKKTSSPRFSLTTLMSGKVPQEAIRGKVVIVGVVSEGVKDHFYTSYSRGLDAVQQVPGCELHANIVHQLIRAGLEGKTPVSTWSERQEEGWVLAWSLAGGLIGFALRGLWRFALVVTGGVVLIVIMALLALMNGWWIPLIPPALTWVFSSSLMTAYLANKEKKERDLVMQLFSRHVSGEVAETVWNERDQFIHSGRLRSQKLIVTTLFSDLEGFTHVAENMDPQQLMEWLNTFMEPMAKIIMDHGGVVDDYYGDAIKANFGVPFARKNEGENRQDAIHAVTCALAMEREMVKLHHEWQDHQLPTVRMRIGIYTGPVVVGSLGSAQRLKYTTIGDTVNVAARIESLDKQFTSWTMGNGICRILVGESTHQYIEGLWQTQEVGQFSLKGKDTPIIVYRVIGQDEQGEDKGM